MTKVNGPFRRNFEKNSNWQEYYYSLKEDLNFSKVAKFGCELL